MLKVLVALSLLFSSARADVQWVNFSFLFGSSTLEVDGRNTHGSGWSAITEVYLSQNGGVIATVGSSHTEANSIDFFGQEVASLEIDNRYVQPGVFIYPFKGLRLSAGPSFNWVDQEYSLGGETKRESASFAGPFVTLGYKLPIENVVLGAQYNYVRFGDYTQSDTFLLLGFSF